MRKILVSSDWHYPLVDKKAMRRFEQKAFDCPYDDYVVLGDCVDFEMLSKFVSGKPGLMARRIAGEVEQVRERLLYHASLLQAENPKVRLWYIAGNHEARLDNWLERNPQFKKLISVSGLLKLKELGYSYTPPFKSLKLGRVRFSHGSYCGAGHLRKVAVSGGINVYGHTHSLEAGCYEGWDGANGRAYSMGCLAKIPMDYLKGRMCNASHGYGVVEQEGAEVQVFQYRV